MYRHRGGVRQDTQYGIDVWGRRQQRKESNTCQAESLYVQFCRVLVPSLSLCPGKGETGEAVWPPGASASMLRDPLPPSSLFCAPLLLLFVGLLY
jgi:hypothetical protein